MVYLGFDDTLVGKGLLFYKKKSVSKWELHVIQYSARE